MSLGEALVVASAWLSLLLLPAGLLGPATLGERGATRARRLFTLGGLVFGVHVVAAFAVHYDLSHGVALRETARRTEELVGVSAGAGLYFNYAFAALWGVEAAWWNFAPRSYAARSAGATWLVRAFFLFMVANGAVVFVPWPRRALGLLVLGACTAAVGARLRGGRPRRGGRQGGGS